VGFYRMQFRCLDELCFLLAIGTQEFALSLDFGDKKQRNKESFGLKRIEGTNGKNNRNSRNSWLCHLMNGRSLSIQLKTSCHLYFL